MSLSEVPEKGLRRRKNNEEDREGQGGKSGGAVMEFWGRDYSSFSHRKIVRGIRSLSDKDVSGPSVRKI